MEHLFSSTKATTLSGIQIHPGQHRFQLLNFLSSGNLVLIDNVTSNSEGYLWKSYDYPINTWLPGMMIGKDMSNGLNRFLTSCKVSDIASPGDSTYKFDYKGLPQIFIKRGTMKKFRTGPWNGVRFSGLPMPINQFFIPILASQNDMVG